jgi:hypothetical protein
MLELMIQRLWPQLADLELELARSGLVFSPPISMSLEVEGWSRPPYRPPRSPKCHSLRGGGQTKDLVCQCLKAVTTLDFSVLSLLRDWLHT